MDEGRHKGELDLEDLPPTQRHIIKRPRLTKLLDEADARIILLVAPAGYGKTTLAREWTSQRGRQALWFRAREGASDVAATARGLARTLEPVAPGVERAIRQTIAATTAHSDESAALGETLSNAIEHWPQAIWLVVDEHEFFTAGSRSSELIGLVAKRDDIQVLVTSRTRPDWAAPRDLLYGDAFELGGASLAMTHEEASEVLTEAPHASAGLVALADGWPVVIGLASLLPAGVDPNREIRSTVFEYVTQELFAALDSETQAALPILAVPTTLTYDIVELVCGARADWILRSAAHGGFISLRGPNDLEMHPLCRAFLERQHDSISGDPHIRELGAHLVRTQRWDEAFETIRRFGFQDQLQDLFRAGLNHLLSEGRTATIDRWIQFAEEAKLDYPELALARAEIYLRRGNWPLSESLAVSAASRLESSDLRAAAYLCAGAAAHLLDRTEASWNYYGHALEAGGTPEVRRRAWWGRVIASHWMDTEDFDQARRALEASGDTTPEQLVRVAHSRLIAAGRDGDLLGAVDYAMSSIALLERVEDPFIRSGVLNNLSYALTMTGRYVEAEAFAQQGVEEAKRFRLAFALPTALANLAVAKIGLGDFGAAAALTDESEKSDVTADHFVRLRRGVIRATLELARMRPAGARAALETMDFTGARPDIHGETLAMRALAEACDRDIPSARATVRVAEPLAVDVVAQVLIAAARAIVDMNDDSLTALARVTTQTGDYDALVCALRACPELVVACLGHDEARASLRVAAANSGDPMLSRAVGSAPRSRGSTGLSRREHEVLILVAQGLHNDDIGKRLFISGKTVKTHLQNIYEKLGVSSRTEAAMKAREAGLLS